LGFDRLIGQPAAAARLSGLIARGRLPHAMLFVGPAGVGKHDAAKILAQVLMCTARAEGDPNACDVCPACHKVKESVHADVHVVANDARTLKVDEIREATRALQLRPMEGVGKYLVVHDADKMTIEAQNALLKTLEEPPGRSWIVLLTTRPQTILPTVISRCQRVTFGPIAREMIASVLVKERQLPEPQAMLLAAMAQGSLEGARTIDVEALVAARDRVALFDQRLVPGKKSSVYEALEMSQELGEDREELDGFLDLLLVWLHDQAVLASGADPAGVANVDRRSDLDELVERRGLRTILERSRVALAAKRQLDLPYNLNRQMIAEQLCLGLAGEARITEERRFVPRRR
jgi:DNA polymerase III subunit delta'